MPTRHNNLTLIMLAAMIDRADKTVIDIGNHLTKISVDKLFPLGFWIWDVVSNVEYYSPNFIKSLGYDESYTPKYTPDFWMNHIETKDREIAINNFNKHKATEGEHPYDQEVTYNRIDKSQFKVICSGTIFKDVNKKPAIMLGSHITPKDEQNG